MAMSDDLIRAAVKAGHYTDPESENFLASALIERREKIGRAWLTAVNPIADPALSQDGVLTFRNIAVDLNFAPAPPGYQITWFRFDNMSGESTAVGESTITETRATAPSTVLERVRADTTLPAGRGQFVRVDISATGGTFSSWSRPVCAYFRRTQDGWKLVGFDRMPDAPPMRPGLVGAETK
jgi:hypothetical protein